MPKLYAGGRGVSLVAVAQAVTKLVPVIVPLIVPKVPEMTKTFQVISGGIAPNSYKGFGVNPRRYRLVENGGFRTMKPVRKSSAIRTRNHKVKYRNVDDPLCRRSPPTKGRASSSTESDSPRASSVKRAKRSSQNYSAVPLGESGESFFSKEDSPDPFQNTSIWRLGWQQKV